MQLISCLHPVTFTKDGITRTVPCGHCALCRNKVSNNWIRKIQLECQSWKYAYFVTLTYDNEHLPLLYFDSKNHRLVNDDGEFIDLNLKEFYYVRKRGGKISYPCTRDFQLFIKRLRYYFYEHNKKTNNHSPLRYFIATEYGPTTHRIHAHAIFWFNDNSNLFAAQFAEFVRLAWKNGNIVSEPIQTSKDTAKYVSKYVNVDYNRFSLFKTSLLRPKIYFSKSPAIGTLLFYDDYIKKLFLSSSPLYRVQLANEAQDVPLPYSIKYRLFPKVPGFNKLSHIQRIGIYSVSKWSNTETIKEFLDWYDNQNLFEYDVSIQQYVPLDVLGFYHNDEPIFNTESSWLVSNRDLPIINYLYSLIDYKLKDPFYNVKYVWRVSRRVLHQCSVFGVSLDSYVRKIEKYYDKVDLLNLKTWYELQDKVSRQTINKHPVGCFIYLDSHFVNVFLSFNQIEQVPYWMMSTLWGYNINPYKFFKDKEYRDSFNPELFPDVKDYVNKITFSYLQSHKTKQKKEYLRLHPEYNNLSKFNLSDL